MRLQQVMQFDTAARRDRRAPGYGGSMPSCPTAVAVRWAVAADETFDARFGATARTYWYVLMDAPVRPPLWRDRAGWTHRGARRGTHGAGGRPACWAATISPPSARASARRPRRSGRSSSLEVVREGPFLLLAVTANAFLHHMVRNLVGSLVYVGDGRRPVEWVARGPGVTQPLPGGAHFSAAGGLYLASVRYDSRWQLPVADPAPRLCELV